DAPPPFGPGPPRGHGAWDDELDLRPVDVDQVGRPAVEQRTAGPGLDASVHRPAVDGVRVVVGVEDRDGDALPLALLDRPVELAGVVQDGGHHKSFQRSVSSVRPRRCLRMARRSRAAARYVGRLAPPVVAGGTRSAARPASTALIGPLTRRSVRRFAAPDFASPRPRWSLPKAETGAASSPTAGAAVGAGAGTFEASSFRAKYRYGPDPCTSISERSGSGSNGSVSARSACTSHATCVPSGASEMIVNLPSVIRDAATRHSTPTGVT